MLAVDRRFGLCRSCGTCYPKREAGKKCTKQPGQRANIMGPLTFNNKPGDLGADDNAPQVPLGRCASSPLGNDCLNAWG